MQQTHRPGNTAQIIQIGRKVQPMEKATTAKVHPGYKADEAFKSVTELLCTTEAFLLGKLNQLTQPELEKVRREARNIEHISSQIVNRISQEINARYQE
jgi:hypothetical protein